MYLKLGTNLAAVNVYDFLAFLDNITALNNKTATSVP